MEIFRHRDQRKHLFVSLFKKKKPLETTIKKQGVPSIPLRLRKIASKNRVQNKSDDGVNPKRSVMASL